MRINVKQTAMIASTLLLPLSIFSCGGGGGGGGGGGDDEIENLGEIDASEDGAIDSTETEETSGITSGNALKDKLDNPKPKVRNYQQFLHTYTGILELDPQDATIANEFSTLETSLPTGTSVGGFLGSHQLTLVKLGSFLCENAFSSKTPEDRQKIFGVDQNSSAPIDVFGPINVVEIGKTMMSRFWGIDKGSIEDDDVYLNTLTDLASKGIKDLEAFNDDMSDADIVRLAVTGMCTSAITSAHVSFYGY